MEIAKNRPLCLFCWLVVGMILFQSFFPVSKQVLLLFFFGTIGLVTICLLFSIFLPSFRWKGFFIAFLLFAFVLTSGVLYIHQSADKEPIERFIGENDEEKYVSGIVLSRDYDSNYQTVLTVEISVDQKNKARSRLVCSFVSELQPGDRFSVCGKVSLIENAEESKENLSDMLAQGYRLCVEVTDSSSETVLERDVKDIRLLFSEWQRSLALRIQNGVGGEEGKLAAALLLGTKDALSDGVKTDFRRSGVSHLLALSGLHLTLMMGMLSMLLEKGRLPFRFRLVILSVCAVFYLLLTGCAMSTLRATAMMLYLNVSKMFGRQQDSLTSLSLFLAICLLISPMSVYSTGLWLSCLAAFALVELIPVLSFGRGKSSFFAKCFTSLRDSLLASLLIMLFMTLPMALFFGEFSLISPLSTIILTPLTALTLMAGTLFSIVGLFPGNILAPVSAFFAWVMKSATGGMIALCETGSDLKNVMISLEYPFFKVLLLVLTFLFLGFLFFHWKKPKRFLYLLAAWCLCVVLCLSIYNVYNKDQIRVVDQTHGNKELLLFTEGQHCVLCDLTDGSYTTYRDLAEDGLPAYCTEVDALVLTHYHERHISTMLKVLSRFRVREIWLPITMPYPSAEKAAQDEGIMLSLAEIAKGRRVKVHFFDPSEETEVIKGVVLRTLFYEMLSRSTHPTLAMNWALGDSSDDRDIYHFLYIGSSTPESVSWEKIEPLARESDGILFGIHGPVLKKDILLPNLKDSVDFLHIVGESVFDMIVKNQDMGNLMQKDRITLKCGDGRWEHKTKMKQKHE